MGKIRYSVLNPTSRPALDLKPEDATSAMLRVLDWMQDFDILPATYIKHQFGHWHGTRVLLTDLAKAHFIGKPDGYKHNNARNRPRPLEIWPRGFKALEVAGKLRKRDRMNDHFGHAYLRSVIDHSFRQAAREIPGLIYHSEADILAHPNTPKATREQSNPSWFEVGGHTVRPDAPLFGYEYKGPGEQSAFMFFHGFEADRATERQTAKNSFTKKTIERMFEQYAAYFRQNLYREKYGLSQVTVPIITVGEQRLHVMLETLKAAVPEDKIRRRFIFKSLPNFLENADLPPATGHMVTEPWIRVDGEFSIIDTLKTTAARKEVV